MRISSSDLLHTLKHWELENMLDENPSCKGLLTGYIAEQRLKNDLLQIPGLISVTKIPDQDVQKGDLLVEYQKEDGTISTFTIEVKCVNSDYLKEPLLEGGISSKVRIRFSYSVSTKAGLRTSSVLRNSFDILAICLVTVTGNWDFRFIHNKYIPTSSRDKDRLVSTMIINTENTPCLHTDIRKVIQDIS